MQSLSAQFLNQIETYLATTGMKPTVFGREVMGDPKFVFDLRKGRSPSLRTIERVQSWMFENGSEDAA